MRPLTLEALAPDVGRRVAVARETARKIGTPLYLVGGAVRDLLLGRPVVDVDLVVPSDAPAFARRLAFDLGGLVKVHGRFGTATVELPDGGRLDLATARAEEYERPGALPRVRSASIADDLARRDFTINSMAAEISQPRTSQLIDPLGGREDLQRRCVRALHSRSFFDDPTRAFRAVRYANRLGFQIEPGTRASIRMAARKGAVDTISGERLRREIVLLFSEAGRAAGARELARLGLAGAVHPSMRYDAGVGRRLRDAERLADEFPQATWLVYLLSWMGSSSEPAARTIAASLSLPRESRDRVTAWPARRRRLELASAGRPSTLAELISALDDDTVLAALVTARPDSRRPILAAREAARGFRLSIGGADLIAAGVLPGPAVGRALARTLAARRDGAIPAEEELRFALKAARG